MSAADAVFVVGLSLVMSTMPPFGRGFVGAALIAYSAWLSVPH